MPDDRPTSMGQALESAGFGSDEAVTTDATPDQSPAETSADASSASTESVVSDAATTAASPTVSPQQAEPAPGPLPYERHKAILDKAYAERDALKAKVEAVGWAEQVPAEVGPKLVEMARRVQGDPVGFLVELAAEVQNDPRHAAALRSHAAKVLGTRPAQPSAALPAQLPDHARSGVPEVDALLEARDKWLAEQLADQLGAVVNEKVGPLAALAQRVAEAEAAQQASQAAQAFAASEFEAVSKLPGFLDHRKAIGDAFEAEMAKIPKEQQDARAPVVLRDVYAAIVLPSLTKSSADTVRQTLTAKAVQGSLGARPSTAASVSRPRTMSEALANAGF